jgi:phosphatidylglycerol lysyltransferase
VLRYGWNTLSYQILNPGIAHWFLPGGDGVVGYVPAGRTWVAAGAPICAPALLAETAEAFEVAAARLGRRVCYFGSQERLAEALVARGPLARLLVGAQPAWEPAGWAEIVVGKPSLRAQLARARNKRVVVEDWPATAAAGSPAVRRCLSEWLATRGLPSLHFLVEPETLAAPEDHRVFVALRGGAVVAYLVATPIPQRGGWLLEQIVRGSGAPNGTAELLIDAAMRACAAEGGRYVTLGLAPLSKHVPEQAPAPPIHLRWLLAWMRAHGQRFYNFAGLDAFKAKLQPHSWEPVYLLSRERTTSLRTLYAVTAAFGGAPPPLFLGHALARAAAQELRWAGRRLEQARGLFTQRPVISRHGK